MYLPDFCGCRLLVGFVLKPKPGDIILFFVPLFIALIAIEHILLLVTKLKVPAAHYTPATFWSSIAAGTTQQAWHGLIVSGAPFCRVSTPCSALTQDVTLLSPQLSHISVAMAPYFGYEWVYNRSPFNTVFDEGSLPQQIFAFLAADLAYYLYHRAGHEVCLPNMPMMLARSLSPAFAVVAGPASRRKDASLILPSACIASILLAHWC